MRFSRRTRKMRYGHSLPARPGCGAARREGRQRWWGERQPTVSTWKQKIKAAESPLEWYQGDALSPKPYNLNPLEWEQGEALNPRP